MSKVLALHPGTPPSMWYAHSPAPTPLGLAVHLGWLNGEWFGDGISIKSPPPGNLVGDPTLLREHRLHHAFRQGSVAPVAWARSRGADSSVIGLTWTDEAQQVIALPASGIRDIAGLRGRRIGIPRRQTDDIDMFRAAALRGILGVLALEGMDHHDVELVHVDTHDLVAHVTEVAALERGEVDAIYVRGAPGVAVAQRLRATVVADLRLHPDPAVRNNGCTLRVLTVNNTVLSQFPDIVSGFLRLVVDAGRWARSHPADVTQYALAEAQATAESVRQAYGPDLHQRLGLTLEADSLRALDAYRRFLLEWKFLKQDFDLGSWIDPRPLAGLIESGTSRIAV